MFVALIEGRAGLAVVLLGVLEQDDVVVGSGESLDHRSKGIR